MKIEIFKKTDKWAEGDKLFTHYWYNDGQNFFDSVEQYTLDGIHTSEKETLDFVSIYDGYKGPTEAYLEQFKGDGVDTENQKYKWVEISNKIQRNDLYSFQLELQSTDIENLQTLFFRVTEDNENVSKYYYATSLKGMSDVNFPTTYLVDCEIDMWATYWVYMHSIMKGCTEDVDFLQKMCDRFQFNYQEGVDTKGFIINYLDQPYLLRSAKYETMLYANDQRENFLTLEEWLYINSGKKDIISLESWVDENWIKWLSNSVVGTFCPDKKNGWGSGEREEETSKPTFSTEDIGKYQNAMYTTLSGDSTFFDNEYNSNTKYRYLVCKVGNNTLPKYSDLKEEEGVITSNYIKGMFAQFDQSNRFALTSQKTKETYLQGTSENVWEETVPTTESTPGSYEFIKTVDLENVNLESTGAVCIYWDNYLISEKYLRMTIESSILDSYDITWFNNFEEKTHRTVLNSVSLGKEYSIIDLPTKSYVFDIYNDILNVTLSINIKFIELNQAQLVFRLKFDKNYEKIVYPKLTVYADKTYTINPLYISNNDNEITTSTDTTTIDGETLMIIPFKKGRYEQEYIKWLNSSGNGINMGDGSVLGMPINDIPPAVLGLAIRRQNDESDYQTIGDMLSIRHAEGINCPLSLVDLHITNRTDSSKYIDIPSLFTSFDYTPVVIASAPLKTEVYNCIGGNNFFNYYYDILTNTYLTGNNWYIDDTGNWNVLGGNRIESEPFLYGPQFWKWAYYIDGSHLIELSGEKLDFTKLITNDKWEVKLNVNFNSNTGYFLDISDIKNNKYPMSKLGVEYVTGDPACFPYTTEAYNNWLQGNQLTQETAKNAKDITNKFVKKRGITDAVVGSLEEGFKAAAPSYGKGLFGIKGAVAAGVAGTTVAAAHAAGAVLGMEWTMQENNEQFENKWRGELANMYNAPSQLNPSGFTSGSLVYSPTGKANQNSYELFRTFSAPDNVKQKVWHDISMNGYPYLSQCLYKDYNNRLNYNVVNCNLYDKQYLVINFLKEKMFEVSPIFAQTEFILSFVKKCQDLFRVFKCAYEAENMNKIIETNIELKREWVEPYYAPARTLVVEVNKELGDNQTSSWVWSDEYEWSEDGTILSKKPSNILFDTTITYKDLGVANFEAFKNTYSNVELGLKNSLAYAAVNDKPVESTLCVNTNDYGPDGIKLPDEIRNYISTISVNEDLKNAIYIKLNNVTYNPTSYRLGWDVVLEDNTTSLKVKLTPVSEWTFTKDVHEGTIYNKDYPESRSVKEVAIGWEAKRTFERGTDAQKYSYCIWQGGDWKNDFKEIAPDNILYYDRYSKGWKGAVHPMNDKTLGIKTIPYVAINPNIKTREQFIEYYDSFKINIYSIIKCSYKWPEATRGNHDCYGTGDLECKLTSGQYSFAGDLNLIGLGSANDGGMPEGWNTPYLIKQDTSTSTTQAVAGMSQSTRYSAQLPHYARAEGGKLSTRIHYLIGLSETGIEIAMFDTSWAANWGRHSDECYPKVVPYPEYGLYVNDDLTEHQWAPSMTFFGLGRDENLDNLETNTKINKISFIPRTKVNTSTWHMNNKLNNVVFVRRDINLLADSYIEKKIKEGN